MGEIVLVRHGQANSEARDEESYDRLSDLGHLQARWLGEHFRLTGEGFDEILCGTLTRHRETAKAMGVEPNRADPRINELDYFNLSDALEKAQGIPRPAEEDFAAYIPKVMEAWHRAEIMGVETFAAFEARIAAAMKETQQPGRRVLWVTSGGVIGMVLRHLLDLNPTRMAHVFLPITNTSIHRVAVTPHGAVLSGFNATPHLDAPERAYAKTHY